MDILGHKNLTIKSYKAVGRTKFEDLPEWFQKAQTENAEVTLAVSASGIVWAKGVWYNGIWNAGWWFSGEWKNGTWLDGFWANGIWHDGTWFDGQWFDGTWVNGTWMNGKWHDGHWVKGKKNYETCLGFTKSGKPIVI